MARWGYHGSMPQSEVGTFGHEGPDTFLAGFGDLKSFEAVLGEHGSEIACVRELHTGTFNGNPITTAAGLVSIRHLTSNASPIWLGERNASKRQYLVLPQETALLCRLAARARSSSSISPTKRLRSQWNEPMTRPPICSTSLH
jgi:hypothetical protein